jgi:hypothetical protein
MIPRTETGFIGRSATSWNSRNSPMAKIAIMPYNHQSPFMTPVSFTLSTFATYSSGQRSLVCTN